MAVVGFAGGLGALSLLRYRTFHSRSLDMAYYVRLVWGMAHGRPDNPVVDAPHWLGLHLEPILFVPAALSRLGLPVAELLLVLQAAVAALALPPIHALCRRRIAPLLGETVALLVALSIYLLPAVSRCVDYDFHPSTLLIAPLCAWIDAVDQGRWGRAWAWMAVSLCFREDVGLQLLCAASAAAAWGTFHDRSQARRHLLGQAGLSALWFAVYALLVQPRYLPDPAGGSFGAHFARFGGGQGGVAGVVRAALADPAALGRYLVSGDRPGYPLALLFTVGGVALAAPRWLAGALPLVLINLASDFPGVRLVQSHYATAMAPFLAVAAVAGVERLTRVADLHRPALRRLPAALLLLSAGSAFALRGASPLAPDFTFAAYRDDDDSRAARALVARANSDPAAPRVVAEARVLAHLAERPEPILDPAQRYYWKARTGGR